MEVLERCMLRRENALYKLKYAMAALKLNHSSSRTKNVSFRDGEFLTEKTVTNNPSAHSIQLENKELYLRYVEEVLSAKEKELVQLEQHLNMRRQQLEEQEGELKLSHYATINHHTELIAKKITSLREVASKLSICKSQAAIARELEEFQNGLVIIEESCRKSSERMNAQFLHEYEQLNAERQQISAMKNKLHELQSYEKYLNELQSALEHKEYQIIVKERELQQLSLAFCESNSQTLSLKHQFNTYQQENPQSDQSLRKRAKIFEPRMGSQEKLQQHKESSKIMQENSTNDYTKQIQTQKQSKETDPSQQVIMCVANASSQTQPTTNEAVTAFSKIHCEKVTLKFVKLWLKFSERTDRGGASHKKCMNLYLWRLNALYDESSKRKMEKLLSWPAKIERLGEFPPFEYKELSLRKRKYIELFFNYERKNFQRTKILTHLCSILKNKNRRERTAVYLSFQKYRSNAKMMSLMNIFQRGGEESVLVEKQSNVIQKKVSNKNAESRIIGTSASENRVVTSDHSRIKLNSSKITPSVSTTSKTRLLSKEQAAIDIPRLKEYIKNQEETEVKLATECAQTEAVFRIFNVMTTSLYRLRTRFIVNSIRLGETSRLNALEKAMNASEFKWQLFMAKARLALTNNSNKIAHLQQVVGFMDCK